MKRMKDLLRGGASDKLKDASGWSMGKDFAGSLASMGRERFRVFKGARTLLEENLAKEDELVKGDFSETLRMWGIRPGDERVYIRHKTREIWCGVGLAAFSAAGDVMLMLSPIVSGMFFMLATTAVLSMFCCGSLMALAAAWRRSVVAGRKFVPFLSWLKDFFVKP